MNPIALKFKLEIECDNAAFKHDDCEEDPIVCASYEVSNILRRTLREDSLAVPPGESKMLRDRNGNTVGRAEWIEDDADAVRVFLELLAAMKADGEEDDQGNEFVMENDDAVTTLSELIVAARRVLSGEEDEAVYRFVTR